MEIKAIWTHSVPIFRPLGGPPGVPRGPPGGPWENFV